MISIKVAPGIKQFDKHNNIIYIKHREITFEELINELNIDKIQVGVILVDKIPKRLTDKVENDCEIYLLPILEGG